jgi:hypothetical protein
MTALRVHGLKSLRARIAIPGSILVILAILVPGFIAVHQAIKTPCPEGRFDLLRGPGRYGA